MPEDFFRIPDKPILARVPDAPIPVVPFKAPAGSPATVSGILRGATIAFDGFVQPVEHGYIARRCLELGFPTTAAGINWASRAGTFLLPLGPNPGRGWILVSRRDLDRLASPGSPVAGGLNGLHTLTYYCGQDKIEIVNLVVATAPVCVTPGAVGDPAGTYLVELADPRYLAQNEHFCNWAHKSYNVPAPDGGWVEDGGDATPSVGYYDDSLDGSSPWTWQGMLDDLWDVVNVAELGDAPQLPYEPQGVPTDWKFLGVPAWQAYNDVLAHLKCAFAWLPDGTCAVVQKGEADSDFDALEKKYAGSPWSPRDLDPVEVKRTRVASRVVVRFKTLWEQYGQEPTPPADATQWSTLLPALTNPLNASGGPTYEVAVNAPASTTGLQQGSTHYVQDDLVAVYRDGGILNRSDVEARAQERADDYYRVNLSGPKRLKRTYSGFPEFVPGSRVTAVAYSLRGEPRASPFGGATTEVYYARELLWVDPEKGELCLCPQAESLRGPDLARQTYPLYPEVAQHVRINDSYPSRGSFWSAARVMVDTPGQSVNTLGNELVWALPINRQNLQAGKNYPARLVGQAYGRPLYAVSTEDVVNIYNIIINVLIVNITNINYITISNNIFVFNEYNQTINYFYQNVWYTFCTCASDYHPPPPPPPPECIPGLCNICADPPFAWTFTASGFSGNCSVINGLWNLYPTAGNCVWAGTLTTEDGVVVEANLAAGPKITTLTFTFSVGGRSFANTYVVRQNIGPNCCQNYVAVLYDCACATESGAVTPCAWCQNTPLTWDMPVSGFGGDMAVANDSWTLWQDGTDCGWSAYKLADGSFSPQSGPSTNPTVAHVTLSFAGDGTFSVNFSVGNCNAVYFSDAIGGNCCDPVTVTRQGDAFCLYQTSPPSSPTYLTLVPNCGDAVQDCPPQLALVPICCEHPPVDCCATLPNSFLTDISGFGDDCDGFNSSWNLLPTSDSCIYEQALGSVTVRLTLTSTTWTLELIQSGTVKVRYVQDAPSDCCQSLLFDTAELCDCTGTPSGGGTPCTPCDTTPSSWSFTIPGVPGQEFGDSCLGVYNAGSYTLSQIGPCDWSTGNSFALGVSNLTVLTDGSILLRIESYNGGVAEYVSAPLAGSCCAAVNLSKSSASCDGLDVLATAPSIITVSPFCPDGSSCPPVTVSPQCGGGVCNIGDTGVGQAGSGVSEVATLTIPSVSVDAGSSLIVTVGVAVLPGNTPPTALGVTAFGQAMIQDYDHVDGELRVLGFHLPAPAVALSGDIVLSLAFAAGCAMAATEVRSGPVLDPTTVFDAVLDQISTNDGNGGTPNSGATPTSAEPCEYAQAGILWRLKPIASGVPTWGNGYTAGWDISFELPGGAQRYRLIEGWNKLDNVGSTTALVTAFPNDPPWEEWVAGVAVYKNGS